MKFLEYSRIFWNVLEYSNTCGITTDMLMDQLTDTNLELVAFSLLKVIGAIAQLQLLSFVSVLAVHLEEDVSVGAGSVQVTRPHRHLVRYF